MRESDEYKWEAVSADKPLDIKAAVRRYKRDAFRFARTFRLLRYFGIPGIDEESVAEPQHCQSLDHCMGCNKAELLQEDLDCLHAWLDDQGAPRTDIALVGVPEAEQDYSAIGRIKALLGRRS